MHHLIFLLKLNMLSFKQIHLLILHIIIIIIYYYYSFVNEYSIIFFFNLVHAQTYYYFKI